MAINLEKIRAQLRKPPEKREFGGHGDEVGFLLLINALVDSPSEDDAALLFTAAMPVPLRNMDCSTCRFAEPMQYERDPCLSCVAEGPPFPKWRSRASK